MRIRETYFGVSLGIEEIYGHLQKLTAYPECTHRDDFNKRLTDPMINIVKRK